MARTEAPGRDVTPLPARTGPLMLTHLVMTGDLAQHREWQEQIEEIRRLEAVDATTDPQRKALLQRVRGLLAELETALDELDNMH